MYIAIASVNDLAQVASLGAQLKLGLVELLVVYGNFYFIFVNPIKMSGSRLILRDIEFLCRTDALCCCRLRERISRKLSWRVLKMCTSEPAFSKS